jgi:uncharacterized protein with FMN-binding domain
MSLRPFGEGLHKAGFRLTVSVCLFAASALVYWQNHRAMPPSPRNLVRQPAARPIPAPQISAAPEPVKPEVNQPSPPPIPESQDSPTPVPAAQPEKRAIAMVRPPSPYKDGEFTGNPVDIEYGLVQIGAVIRDGQIVDIKWLQDPEDIDLSRQINQDAMPKLTREAIAAQKSEVDMVTGATFTVLGFRLSLSTALAQAAQSGP